MHKLESSFCTWNVSRIWAYRYIPPPDILTHYNQLIHGLGCSSSSWNSSPVKALLAVDSWAPAKSDAIPDMESKSLQFKLQWQHFSVHLWVVI